MPANEKKSDLKKLSQKAMQHDVTGFLNWLAKNRPISIKGRSPGGPRYHNNISIKDESEYAIAVELCERLLDMVNQSTFKPTPTNVHILHGIISRLRQEARKLQNRRPDYALCVLEARFLHEVSEEKAASFVINLLYDGDAPFNDQTESLYEMLFELDPYFSKMDRLKQRKILSQTYRNWSAPPFFLDDNVSVIFNGSRLSIASITPKQMDTLSRAPNVDDIPSLAHTLFGWSLIVINREESFEVFDANRELLGNIPKKGGEILFSVLIKDKNLKDGITTESIVEALKIESYKMTISRINELTSENNKLIVNKRGSYKLNPDVKILYIRSDRRSRI